MVKAEMREPMQTVDVSVNLGGIRMKNPDAYCCASSTYAFRGYNLFTIRLESESENEGEKRKSG